MNHLKTWQAWVDNISPFSNPEFSWRVELKKSLAEALAIAIPTGPTGMICEEGYCPFHRTNEVIRTNALPESSQQMIHRINELEHQLKSAKELLEQAQRKMV